MFTSFYRCRVMLLVVLLSEKKKLNQRQTETEHWEWDLGLVSSQQDEGVSVMCTGGAVPCLRCLVSQLLDVLLLARLLSALGS